MKPISEMSAGELAAYVAGHLKQSDIEVVLSGGACVTIWSEGLYVSADLDLIGDGTTPRSSLRKALAEIGFVEQGRQFVHPDARFFVDCPSGPVALGREAPKEIRTIEFASGSLRLLSPTDCVKDRLLAERPRCVVEARRQTGGLRGGQGTFVAVALTTGGLCA